MHQFLEAIHGRLQIVDDICRQFIGPGRLSRSARDLSLIQKISRLVLSRFRMSSTIPTDMAIAYDQRDCWLVLDEKMSYLESNFMNLREGWAKIVNRAYERNGCPERVSHLSLEAQEEYREPIKYLPPAELWKQRKQVCPRSRIPEQEPNHEKRTPFRDIHSLAEGRSR